MRKPMPLLLALLVFIALAGCGQSFEVAPLPDGAVVLAFGDSVTHGTGAGNGSSYPRVLSQLTGLDVVNDGIPGDTAAQARGRIEGSLDRHAPSLVIVELGGNDFLARRSPDQVRADLRAIIQTIQDRNIPVILVAVPEFSVLRASAGMLKDSPIYAQLGEEMEIPVVADLFGDILSDDSLTADPIHPNARGYQALAEGIHQFMANHGFIHGN